jgi:hypothetical protein
VKKLLLLFVTVTAFSYARSQSLQPFVVAAQGDYFTSAGGSISWTLGEIMGETYTTAGNMLTQGFQQPPAVATGIYELQQDVAVSLFPNPFNSVLTISSEAGKGELRVYNMLGKLINSWIVTKGNTELFLTDVPNGMYIAVFTNTETQTARSFKITKSE